MNALILFLVFVALATAVFAFLAVFASPASVLGSRLQTVLGRRVTAEKPALQERIQQVLEPISYLVPKSPTEVSETRLWLMQAGYREPEHLKIYFAIRGLAAVAVLGLAFLTGMAQKNAMMIVAAPALGFFLPRFGLKRRIRARQERIQLALPDALDLAIICVEAGLGLDQALDRVGTELRKTHPDLSDELMLVTLEMRAGKSRADALRNFAGRTESQDIRSFVAVLIQTERFGTSIASALRVHSDSLRTERRQRAEERAAKTTIKMVPALVFFIFPVMFFVLLGPAVISIIRNLLPTLNNK